MTVVYTGCGSVVNWMSSARAKTASENVMASIPVYNFIVRIGTGGWARALIRRFFIAPGPQPGCISVAVDVGDVGDVGVLPPVTTNLSQ
jgi:hypothetical protein